jgi:hypothetical protein
MGTSRHQRLPGSGRSRVGRIAALAVVAVVVDMGGLGVFAGTALAASGLSWSRPVRIDTVGRFGVTLAGLSCPSSSLCVTLDARGNILTSTDPGARARARWSRKNVEGYHPGKFFNGIACPSTGLCTAVDDWGHVFSSTDPSAGRAARWVKQSVDRHPIYGVACATPMLCVAVDKLGAALSSTNPTAGRQARWVSSPAEPGAYSTAPSCPSSSLCLLANSFGQIVTSSNPAGPSSQWAAKDIDGDPLKGTGSPLSAVSCPSITLCVAVDAGGNTLTSTDPKDGFFASWQTKNVLGHFSGGYYSVFEAISCPSESFCVGVGDHGRVTKIVTSTDPGAGRRATWSTHILTSDPNASITHLSCPTAALCVAADDGGDVIVGTQRHS